MIGQRGLLVRSYVSGVVVRNCLLVLALVIYTVEPRPPDLSVECRDRTFLYYDDSVRRCTEICSFDKTGKQAIEFCSNNCPGYIDLCLPGLQNSQASTASPGLPPSSYTISEEWDTKLLQSTTPSISSTWSRVVESSTSSPSSGVVLPDATALPDLREHLTERDGDVRVTSTSPDYGGAFNQSSDWPNTIQLITILTPSVAVVILIGWVVVCIWRYFFCSAQRRSATGCIRSKGKKPIVETGTDQRDTMCVNGIVYRDNLLSVGYNLYTAINLHSPDGARSNASNETEQMLAQSGQSEDPDVINSSC